MRHAVVILPQYPWPEARRRWALAEELGFDAAYTYDHLSWRSLADEPWGATVPTLAAAALVTTRIRLGTFVASPNYRHPVPFAKELATLDDLSGGRMTVGLGSGGTGFDATVLGRAVLEPRARHERFDEFVTLLDALLRFEESGSGGISRPGEWFTAAGARMVGRPAQLPRMPFVIGGNGPKGLALVVRHGQGWVTTGREGATGDDWWAGVADQIARLDDALAAAGRDPETLERHLSLDSGGRYSLESVGAFDDAVGRADELGFTDVVSHWPRESGLYAGSEEVLDEVASRFGSPSGG